MDEERKKLVAEFWDRTDKLNIENKDYHSYAKSWISGKLKEDIVDGDLTTNSLINKNKKINAVIIAKQDGIVAGIEESLIFDLNITKMKNDGDTIKKTDKILEINDDAKKILSHERTLLNLLQRMSGIATQAFNMQDLIKNNCFIAGTRKTVLGMLDKKALSIGGALTHRLDLSDSILIKENHLQLLGNDFEKALEFANKNTKTNYIEIEVKNKGEALKAAEALLNLNSKKMFAIMFDNMEPSSIRETIKNINEKIKKDHKNKNSKKIILLEASGGINEKNILEYSKTGIDIISIGALTHSAKALDFSMDILE